MAQGKGHCAGKLGALRVEMADGKTFKIGTGFSSKDRENPPKIGDIVTYKYPELTHLGIPRHAVFVAVRTDIVWPPRQ